MKNQNTGSNRPAAGQSSLRGMAMWGLCLGGIGMAIAANTAREAKNPAAASEGAVAPVAAVTQVADVRSVVAEPLSSEYKPSSNFPGVMVRSIPEGTKPQAAPKTAGGSASTYRWAGAKSKTVTTRSTTGGYANGAAVSAGSSVERKGPDGSASLRFNRSLYSREGIRVDAKGGFKYECVDDKTLGAQHTHAPGETHRPVTSAQKAPSKTAAASIEN